MRTLRGNNSKTSKNGNSNEVTSNAKNKSRKNKNQTVQALPVNDADDDIGTNGDETTDDEGAIDTPPPPFDSSVEEEEHLTNELSINDKAEIDKKIVQNKEETSDDTDTVVPKVEKKKPKETPVDYEVEQIVDMEIKQTWKCPVKFRVRWSGFTEKDDTWLPEFELSCEEAIEEFLEISGRKPEYTKALEAKKKNEEFMLENQRKSYRIVSSIFYGEQVDDDEEILPSGTKTRKFKNSAHKKELLSTRPNQLKKYKLSSEEYQVGKVVGHRIRGKITEYKVSWVGFGTKHDSWEPEFRLNCQSKIISYMKLLKSMPIVKDEDEEEEEYEVELIIDSRILKGKTEYKVRWKNFGTKFDSWITAGELNCPKLVKEFKKSMESEDDAIQVEKILKMRQRRGKKEYLVHWKSFSSSNDTWEPKESLTGCPHLLVDFLERDDKNGVDESSSDQPESEDNSENEKKKSSAMKRKLKIGRSHRVGQTKKKRDENEASEPIARSRRSRSTRTYYSEEEKDDSE